MSRTQMMRLAVALVVAVAVWGLLALVRGPVADSDDGALEWSGIDTAAVDTIVLAKAGDTTTLARGDGGAWRVNGNPASPSEVSAILSALVDTAHRSELVAASPSSHASLGVDADSGRRVRVVGGGTTVLDLTTGKRSSDYSGLYVRRTGEDAVFSLRGALVDPVGRAADEWRDRRIAAVEPDSVSTIEIRRGTRGYTLRRADSGWTFASGAPADSSSVASLLAEYRNVTASGFPTRAQMDSVDFARVRVARARLLGAGGAPRASLVFDSTASGVWTRADSGGIVFRIEPWTFNRLAPPESTLRAKGRGSD